MHVQVGQRHEKPLAASCWLGMHMLGIMHMGVFPSLPLDEQTAI